MRSFLEKKIIITILSFILLTTGIVFGVITPTVRYIRQLDEETRNLRLTLERKNERVASYRRSLKQMEKIKNEMPSFGDYLFHAGQELTLITTLESLAAKHGVTHKVSNSNLDSISGHTLLMSLNITGSYQKVLSYLSELEHLPYFISVTNFQMSAFTDRNRAASPSQQVSMNIDLRLYVSP